MKPFSRLDWLSTFALITGLSFAVVQISCASPASATASSHHVKSAQVKLAPEVPSGALVVEQSASVIRYQTQPATPTVIQPFVGEGCRLDGCQQEECVDAAKPKSDMICAMMYQYTCYRTVPSRCERQNNGHCGWTITTDLKQCLTGSNS
jgi:hypothetical protein